MKKVIFYALIISSLAASAQNEYNKTKEQIIQEIKEIRDTGYLKITVDSGKISLYGQKFDCKITFDYGIWEPVSYFFRDGKSKASLSIHLVGISGYKIRKYDWPTGETVIYEPIDYTGRACDRSLLFCFIP